MTMLKGYTHMVSFFTRIEWWKADPHDDLVNNGSLCLAVPGNLYVIYLPHGGNVTARLEPGRYKTQWYNPRTGEFEGKACEVEGGKPVELGRPPTEVSEDWALLIRRELRRR